MDITATNGQTDFSRYSAIRPPESVTRTGERSASTPADQRSTAGTPSVQQPAEEGYRPTATNASDEFLPYGPTGKFVALFPRVQQTGQENGTTPDGSNSSPRPDVKIPAEKNSPQTSQQTANGTEKQQIQGMPEDTSSEDQQLQQEIARLRSTEEKVKAHEAAHKSAGGTITGPISYSYTRGPDGKNYITGGEVPISISSGKTPQETISRMQQVIQAALAPADPSSQDRAVAAQASTMQAEARQEQSTQISGNKGSGTAPAAQPADTAGQVAAQGENRTDGAAVVQPKGMDEVREGRKSAQTYTSAQRDTQVSDTRNSGQSSESATALSGYANPAVQASESWRTSPNQPRNNSAESPPSVTSLSGISAQDLFPEDSLRQPVSFYA